jgi:hypothetical protein
MKSLLPVSDMAINLRLFSFVKSLTDLCLFGSLNPLLFQNMPLILTLCFFDLLLVFLRFVDEDEGFSLGVIL